MPGLHDHGIRVIDVRMHGVEGITAAYLVRGERATALVDCGPASSLEATLGGLRAAGVERLDWIVLTHIHLDHAGAAGALCCHFPTAKVAVHPRGARHMVDPSRLWQGVQSVYGERTEELWGGLLPIESSRVRTVAGGERIDLGGRELTAIETPGHARHHHCWLDSASGDIFVGDAVGMQVGEHELWRPTTPPPDFDLELALASLDRLRETAQARLLLGHFGPAVIDGDASRPSEVLDHCEGLLRDWVAAVERARAASEEQDAVVAKVEAWLEGRDPSWTAEAHNLLEQTSAVALDVSGITTWLDRTGPD